jgi:hypothetical protein
MQTEVSCWKEDFEEFCTNRARGIISKFTYGRDVYTSPQINRKIWYLSIKVNTTYF